MELDKIQVNVDEFVKNFEKIRHKKIVIYGTGRRTDRLISRLTGFQIVGLLDSDTSLVGKIKYNLPIISLEEAEENADCIIINTAEIYWDEIFQKVKGANIPIYYRDGTLAQSKQTSIAIDELFECGKCTKGERLLWDIIKERLPPNNRFNNWCDWGFCIWGIVVYTYLKWVYKSARKDKCKKLLFLSRDGYLLHKDYVFFMELSETYDYPEPLYVASSRRLTYVAAISEEEDFNKLMADMFSGTFGEWLMIRFGISAHREDDCCNRRIELPRDMNLIRQWMKPYQREIENEIRNEKAEYRAYLNSLKINSSYGIVDTGYTGKIVSCLSKLLNNNQVNAYYWYGDLRKENPNNGRIKACFQHEWDLEASCCSLRKYVFTVETVFTAPHGMVTCRKNSKFQYGEATANFHVNQLINEGIKQFLEQAVCRVKDDDEDHAFYADKLFGFLIKRTELDETLQGVLRFSDLWNGIV